MILRRSIIFAALTFVASGALTAMSAKAAEPAEKKVFRHVVLFKFKDGTTEAQVKEIVDAFRELKNKIDVIQDFEYGTDVSTENRAQGFTHCFFVTFADDKGRDAYLPHPAHKEFGALVGPRLDKVLVVDYWVQK
jgi:hypothetical protein